MRNSVNATSSHSETENSHITFVRQSHPTLKPWSSVDRCHYAEVRGWVVFEVNL